MVSLLISSFENINILKNQSFYSFATPVLLNHCIKQLKRLPVLLHNNEMFCCCWLSKSFKLKCLSHDFVSILTRFLLLLILNMKFSYVSSSSFKYLIPGHWWISVKLSFAKCCIHLNAWHVYACQPWFSNHLASTAPQWLFQM